MGSIRLAAVFAVLLSFDARLVCAESDAPPTVVRVIPVIDKRLPALTAAQSGDVLSAATTMIERSYGRKVSFELQPEESLPKWFDDRWATIAPYEIPAEYRADLFDEDLARFEQASLNACKAYGSIDQLRNLLDEKRRPKITGYPSAARQLLEQYKERRAIIREMVLPDGSILITPQTRRQFSHGHWGLWFAAVPDIDVIELYLTNILSIDDFLADPAPHALASSMAYGFMYPTTKRVVVTTLPTLLNHGELLPPAMRKVPAEHRAPTIAYTIAHEIGTHVVMGMRDSYEPDAGLARPGIAVNDPERIPDFRNWPGTRVNIRKLDNTVFRFAVLSQRLDVAIARKDRQAAERLIEGSMALNRLSEDQINELARRFNAADW